MIMNFSLAQIGIICTLLLFGAAIVCIVWLYLRLGDFARRLRRFEQGFDTINAEMHKIKRWIKDSELENNLNNTVLNTRIKSEVKDALSNGLIKVQRQIEILESEISKQNEYIEERILVLEERQRELSYIPSNGNSLDEKKISQLFKDGWSIDAIAKEMRLSKGEIEFILKLSGVKK